MRVRLALLELTWLLWAVKLSMIVRLVSQEWYHLLVAHVTTAVLGTMQRIIAA